MTTPRRCFLSIGSASGPAERGFALVATMLMMGLVVTMVLALLAVALRATQTLGQVRFREEARANARLSVLVALGRLQGLAGPDQRVTAGSAILDSRPDSPEPDGVARPHLTGVWRGWKWNLRDDDRDYPRHKRDDFLGWLVSSADPSAAAQLALARREPTARTVELVGPASASRTTDRVSAEVARVGGANNRPGPGIAWAVFDDGRKASLGSSESDDRSLGALFSQMAAAPGPALGEASGDDWHALGGLGKDRRKLVTREEASLVGLPPGTGFHDLAVRSVGLPVDVAQGGLRKDLSLLFDAPALPPSMVRRFLYSDNDQPLAPPPPRFAGANPMPAPDPSWQLLFSHARLADQITGGKSPVTPIRVLDRPAPGTAPNEAMWSPCFHNQQLAPVISKAQFIFSIGFGASPEQATGGKAPGAAAGENWICWLVTDPVITLWNPYNVGLTLTDGRIELYRVPLAFQLLRNGQSYAPATLFSNAYLPGDFTNRQQRFYRLNLKPRLGETQIVMKPGEHLVFTAHNHVKHYNQAYNLTGVDLRPGWNPPAGADTGPESGGISTLNTFVTSTGSNSGVINGASVRSLPVKAGDQIQLAVTPAHAEIDKFGETDQREITAFVKYFLTPNNGSSTPVFVGAMEVDYGARETSLLPAFGTKDLPTLVVPSGIPLNQQGDSYVGSTPPPAVRYKEPFLIASIHLKTELDSRFPSRAWLQNSPTNLHAVLGLDQPEDPRYHQYEFAWEPMTDWNSTPTVEIDARDRGFGASGLYAQSGQKYAPFASLPLVPTISLGQLRHAPLNVGGQLPLAAQVAAGSVACPLIDPDRVVQGGGGRTYLDQSFLANRALFDSWFFSGLAAQRAAYWGRDRSAAQVLADCLGGRSPLPDPHVRPFAANGAEPASEAAAWLRDGGYERIAARLAIDGSFNVNSTSVAAWHALLASLRLTEAPTLDCPSGLIASTRGSGTLVSRHLPATGAAFESGGGGTADLSAMEWSGHRRLEAKQIEALARELVAEVKRRGPFQSLAEFVNRRPEAGPLGTAGALQQAIDRAGVNASVLGQALPVPADPAAAHPEAARGTTADGAPAVLTQADFLTPLAPVLSARSDTFTIRGYGEAGPEGRGARAWCEAVVQRFPEFVDPAVAADTAIEAIPSDSVARRCGRRFRVVSFRWLGPDER